MPLLELPQPTDVRRTLSAVGVTDWDGGKAWWTVVAPSGPATVAIGPIDGAVEVTGWGSGADEAVARVPLLLGFNDDPRAFDPGGLREIHLRSLGLRLGSTGAVFAAVVPAVLGQLVTSVEAQRSFRALRRALGTPAPGPREDLVVPPTAESVASLSYEDLHRFGVERKRAGVIIEAARRAKRLEEILDLDRDGAYQRLTAIRGIGPWTAAMVMGEAWGDRDAVPVGDHNLPSTVTWALRGQRKGTDEEMLKLLEPYRPYRRRAVVLLKQSGVKPPRHGPKTPLRKHL